MLNQRIQRTVFALRARPAADPQRYQNKNIKNKIYSYFIIAVTIIIFNPKSAHASGMEGIGYLIFAFFIFIGVVAGSFIKRILHLPAEERGILKELIFLAMIAEFAFMMIALIIGSALVNIIGNIYNINVLYFSIPIYFILAIFPNLLFFIKENQKLKEVMSKASNILNATIISSFTPAVVLVLFILLDAQ